jgi:hypothetical protein
MTLETKAFNFIAVLTAIGYLTLLGGALLSLVFDKIGFDAFLAAVGTPTGALVAWAARGAVVPKS